MLQGKKLHGPSADAQLTELHRGKDVSEFVTSNHNNNSNLKEIVDSKKPNSKLSDFVSAVKELSSSRQIQTPIDSQGSVSNKKKSSLDRKLRKSDSMSGVVLVNNYGNLDQQ